MGKFKRRHQWAKLRRISAHWWHYEVGHYRQRAADLGEETALSFPRNYFLMEQYER